jgi:hypothetical protein
MLDKRWGSIDKASLGFMEGDMNENRLITYIALERIYRYNEIWFSD